MRLDSENNEVRAGRFLNAIRRLDARDDLFAVLLEPKPAFANRLQVPPARHDGHARARRGDFRGNVAANRACADDCDVHCAFQTHPSANNVDLTLIFVPQ